jgi:hypothetical protein
MSDLWKGIGADLHSPARKLAAVTPSDTADLADVAKSLLVLAAGNVVVIPVDNQDTEAFTFTSVAAGTVIKVIARRVKATGTTATVAAMVG